MLSITVILIFIVNGLSQNSKHPVADKVLEKFSSQEQPAPNELMQLHEASHELRNKHLNSVSDANFYSIDLQAIKFVRSYTPELLEISLPRAKEEPLNLQLFRVGKDGQFKVKRASKPGQLYNYNPTRNYWGIVNGDKHSLVSLSFLSGELMGFVFYDGQTYNLGRVKESIGDEYILFKEKDLNMTSMLSCDTDV